tara:strand:- start:678 stop:2141 length:1464 start_codon:yes stop_codon:yes gene_type:complete
MALIIEQKPLYKTLAVGQDIVFTVSDINTVANYYKPKFTAEIYVNQNIADLGLSTSKVATLKVTPNNKGVGIFSISPIIESYVSPEYDGTNFDNTIFSSFKTVGYTETTPHPIHLIDKYSNNNKVATYFTIVFNIEYYLTSSLATLRTGKNLRTDSYLAYNGVVQNDDSLKQSGNNYGYELNQNKLVFNDYYGSLGKFLSNAPIIQEARLTDYGTLSFFNFLNVSENSFQVGTDNATINMVNYITITLYNSAGVQLGSVINVNTTMANGSFNFNNQYSNTRVMFFGAFPANLDGWSTDWDSHKANVSYYTLQAFDDEDEAISQLYRINIISDDCKGFESIRLTWLNPHGTWDYYTFTKKSVRQLTTNKSTYTQLGGTWNESTFKINGYRGGQKNFRVNTKELIRINTDYLVDADAIWFEDLINSPEVYILNGYDSDTNDSRYGTVNKYVEPVRVMTSSYTRKSKANDKLIQYTFELEKTKIKRTQAI